jgi:oligopeptide/dipeptide ABC transporter ATP-binding protein
MGLQQPTSGEVRFHGEPLSYHRAGMREHRRRTQMIFQDPTGALNARQTLYEAVAEGIRVQGLEGDEEELVAHALANAGLRPPESFFTRYPYEISGGQRQRVIIAGAMVLNPRLLVADEPVSALDVSVQAQIINLLDDLQDEFKLTYLFVAHDLSVVRHVSDRIAVMYLGKLMEVSPAEELYTKPIHPYTSALLAAIPIPDPEQNRRRERIVVSGEPPNPINPPSGCVFHPRCPRATQICREAEPPLARYANGHLAACHHPMNVSVEEIRAATRDETSPAGAGDEMPSADSNGQPTAPGSDS